MFCVCLTLLPAITHFLLLFDDDMPREQMRAADQTLTEDERARAREEGEQGGRSAKYCLKEVFISYNVISHVSYIEVYVVDRCQGARHDSSVVTLEPLNCLKEVSGHIISCLR